MELLKKEIINKRNWNEYLRINHFREENTILFIIDLLERYYLKYIVIIIFFFHFYLHIFFNEIYKFF